MHTKKVSTSLGGKMNHPELANRYDLVLEDEMLADLLAQPGMKSDPIHLNAAGYREMAMRIHALLQGHGAL